MKIGILGATGAVGRQMIECLEEQNIEVDELRLFASERSVGRTFRFKKQAIPVQLVSAEHLAGLDVVLGAVSESLSKEYAPLIKAAGAIYIDNSKAFRLDPEVPLVIPEINGEDARHHHGIIANPNCSTIITLMAAAPIAKISPITRLIASTYQAVSGAGIKGLSELTEETKAVMAGEEIKPEVFPHQIAFNCIPWIGNADCNGYTSEEYKMQNEGRKIMHLPELKVTCTCVRVPVYRSHSISFSLQCERPVSVAEAEEAIRQFPGDKLIEKGYPMPIDTSNQDIVYVGRVRPDLVFDGGLAMFCCGDQIRKGAAANAVQIIRCLKL
ncbi:MAG: aspartate-semialdehyde dehydrogenase [Solobacterium sp.]|jgi:aspartate-semialdehyde dehydrogenase|nr:aspartate-semialdehyde dehydrogenase [Solobacterium sp.]MCH4222565.1 aspartate-semialdehyde dehydrogenase [Solobacterium sp.]MCH4265406.1 aspartate-semialdehyde dehydrogenase [Solobacterium sp.]